MKEEIKAKTAKVDTIVKNRNALLKEPLFASTIKPIVTGAINDPI